MIAKLPWREKVLFQICRKAHAGNFAASGEFSWRGYNTAMVGKEALFGGAKMARELKEDFFRLDGAWASFELMSIRKRDDYLKPFRVLRCKIDDQVDFQAPESLRNITEATVSIEIFGDEELVAAR